MKKTLAIALAMVLIAVGLIFVGNAASADAATAPGASNAAVVSKGTGCTYRMLRLPLPLVTVNGTSHDWGANYFYRACGSYAIIDSVVYYVDPSNNDCGSATDDSGTVATIQNYRVNVDALAGWDPTYKHWDCEVGRNEYRIEKFSPDSPRIFRDGGSIDGKCAYSNGRVAKAGTADVHVSMAQSVCLNFDNN